MLLLLLAAACSEGPKNTAIPGAIAGCPEPAGRLTLYAIPATDRLDWTSPNTLFNTVFASTIDGPALVQSGQAAVPEQIGHVELELDCGADSIPLTAQASDDPGTQIMTDGFGVVFRTMAGFLTETPGPDHDAMITDLALRQADGLVTRISFTVNAAMCTRLKSFHDEYVARKAYVNYGGLYRARRFEGAGCAIFGAAFVDVGGLLRRSLFTEPWSQTVFVGSARFAKYQDPPAYYAFGSNAVARDDAGVDWVWPSGVNVPASNAAQVTEGLPFGDAWFGPEDTPFNLPSLPDELQTKVPFSIYDPQKMIDWAESVWQEASKNGTASSLGVPWTAGTVQSAHEVTYDAVCVMPQTIPFDADNDDLFQDSDAP